MSTIIPPKLQPGDSVRVVAPARSLAMSWLDNEEMKAVAAERFTALQLHLTFSDHIYDIDAFNSSTIESRVADLHAAFNDPQVKMILTVIGGFNSNQLLSYLDYDLIQNNPKIVCGYSDITALTHAIYARTGLVTYSGPHYFSFGDRQGFDYTLEYFQKCLMKTEPFLVQPASRWSNDRWVSNQENRHFEPNDGWWVINEGECEGTIIGANLCTFNLLQGTPYMPIWHDSILFIEDDYESHVSTFDRDLQSVIHQPEFSQVRGIVIGRFQPESGMTRDLLTQIIKSKRELASLPVLANVDFGHTTPQITFPIGGWSMVRAITDDMNIQIGQH